MPKIFTMSGMIAQAVVDEMNAKEGELHGPIHTAHNNYEM